MTHYVKHVLARKVRAWSFLNFAGESMFSSGVTWKSCSSITPRLVTLILLFTVAAKTSSLTLRRPRASLIGNELFGRIRRTSNEAHGKCSSSYGIAKTANTDLNMLKMYDALTFDNPWGGSWTQGWNVQVNLKKFSERKLKVFVVPHSHCDPGWLLTYEEYYDKWVRDILNLTLINLEDNNDMRLIWAEISFFHLRWKELSTGERQRMKRIADKGQLEFVTGGWVVPDESSSHYFSLLTQLIEGHQWLLNHLGYIPKNGWTIDPFGLSPTMAYLLRRSGLNHMVIQRVHYAVKKHLAESRNLEFRWRQMWADDANTDIFCHMTPFYHYDVPYTCGPDPNICCQFDFRRLKSVSNATCARLQAEPIDTDNVERKAMMILDQYRKKAMLFKTNNVLVPLGEDFYWETDKIWHANMKNYRALFDYINSRSKELNAEVKFGTLDEYFSAVDDEIEAKRFSPAVLTGDFFTYADMNEDYWSGYYTSRPFYKSMDRDLLGHLRSAHLLFTFMCAEVAKKDPADFEYNESFFRSLLGKLIDVRRYHSLFQHHDGISGTAKDHVMVDYGRKMLNGFRKANHVMQHSIHILNHLKNPNFSYDDIKPETVFMDQNFIRDAYDQLPKHTLIKLDESKPIRIISVFNPTAYNKTELVGVYVSTYRVTVTDVNDKNLDFEILPVFTKKTNISEQVFLLTVLVQMEGFSVNNVKLRLAESQSLTHFDAPNVFFKNAFTQFTEPFIFPSQHLDENVPIEIENDYLKVTFESDGHIKSVQLKKKNETNNIKLSTSLHRYSSYSGLYLFHPIGPTKEIKQSKPFIRIVKGKFQSYVEVWLGHLIYRVGLFNYKGLDQHSIEIKNKVNLKDEENMEVFMRVNTGVKSGTSFYTDLNGFQMTRRKLFTDKLPKQANVYPMATAAYIEDSNLRVTVLSRQPQGMTSLNPGEMDFMLDRKMKSDDHRGVGQGCTDNKETMSVFKILIEQVQCNDKDNEQKPPMLSLPAHLTLHDLLNPPQVFTYPVNASLHGIQDYSPIQRPEQLACDVQVVDFRMITSFRKPMDDETFAPSREAGLLLHRVGFDNRFSKDSITSECSKKDETLGQFRLHDLSETLFGPELQQTTLTFIHKGAVRSSNESLLLSPNEIYAFLAKMHESQ